MSPPPTSITAEALIKRDRNDPDRLPEEKSRGITIDLAFAQRASVPCAAPVVSAGIVDFQPRRFVRTWSRRGRSTGSSVRAAEMACADRGASVDSHVLGVRRAVVALKTGTQA